MRRIALALTILTSTVALAKDRHKAPADKPPAADKTPEAAAPPAPAVEDPAAAEAKKHFQQGIALYNDGNYAAALTEFEAAYRARPAAAVLYNIGLTQKSLFRYVEAIDSIERYLKESAQIAPEQRKMAEQQVAEMRALLAPVAITFDPPSAGVLVDGRPLGQPLAGAKLASGSHTIEVSADGYKPQKRDVLVTAGQPLALAFKLDLIPKTAHVHVNASKPNAVVRVDGKSVGVAPLDLELPGGGHQLEVSAAKYNPWRSELVITPGIARTVDANLERTAHVYEKWYFWTPIAVVVAGAAVGLGVGLTSREGPLPGTLAPGTGKVN